MMRSFVTTSVAIALLALPTLAYTPVPVFDFPEGPYEIEGVRFSLGDNTYESLSGGVGGAYETRGDLDGDGDKDVVVILVLNSRGSGVFFYLNVLLSDGFGDYSLAGSAFLGDRIRLDDVAIDRKTAQARIEFREHGPGQAMMEEPAQSVARIFYVADGALNEVDQNLVTGARLLEPFKRDLKAALLAGLESGAAGAIDACRVAAPEIASALSLDGVRMGRTSHRLRNPDNAGPTWVTPVLTQYLEADDVASPRALRIDDDRIGYVEPIRIAPLCVSCHGSRLSPDVVSAIATHYPDDQAVGFDIDDLRGVFWVEFPAR